MREVILQQKAERDYYLSQKFILREGLNKINKFLDSDLIKIITGPRRAGKSVFSILLLKDKNFAYLNFDDDNLLKADNYDEILKVLFEVYPESKFILFDEIQNLNNWEVFVNKLQRRGFNLILTGSNARLLSKELATALTGRCISVEILPFSFSEFLKAADFNFTSENLALPETKGNLLNFLDNYLKNGGFPEIVTKNLDVKKYLDTLFDAVLFKDVIKRYNVRFSQKIYDLALYLIGNFCSEFSFTKLRNILDFRSTNTVQNYLRYLEEAYLFFFLNRFSFKMSLQLKAPKKIYLCDNGFILAKAFRFSQNIGKLMENLVFLQLIRKGYRPNIDFFYYKTRNNREVDFIMRKDTEIKELIQVCYNLQEINVKEREIKSLIEAGRELNCSNFLIISWDEEREETYKNKTIKYIPLWKWLLES